MSIARESHRVRRMLVVLLACAPVVAFVGCAQEAGVRTPSRHQAVETYVRGVYAYQTGKKDDAIRELQEAIKGNPQLIMPRILLGGLQKDRNDYQAAAEQYEALVRLDPYFAGHSYNLGVSYQMLQRLRDAEKSYQAAIRLDPKNFGAHMNLGLVYLALGDADKAVKYTDIAARMNPTSAEAFANLAAALDARGDYVLAESAYHKSLEAAPFQAGTLLNYANNLLAQRKPREAIAVLDQAMKIEETPYVHKRKGDAMAMANKLPEALGEYDIAVKKSPKYYAAMNECATVLIQQYKAGMELDMPTRDRAIALWQKSIEINPDQPGVKAALQEWEKRMFSK